VTESDNRNRLQDKVEVEVKKVSPQPGDLVVVCAESASAADIDSLTKLLGDMPFRTIVCNFPVKLEKADANGVLKVVVEGPGDLFAEEDVEEVAATFKQTLESPLEGDSGAGEEGSAQ